MSPIQHLRRTAPRLQSLLSANPQQRWHSGPLYRNTPKSESSPADVQSSQSSENWQPPNSGKPKSTEPNPHRDFYGSFGFPVLKVALGSIFTYQLLYWGWLKLESIDEEKTKQEQLVDLRQQLVDVVKES
ncbi:hypothetical protein BT63DRAFT_453926 [Microthyrium microscopicum]|uniref:Uncharacterized protein n=1 Tax=Microthyrium microscopicum TaxID=703497 RepID=A0A6A6UIB0_9PEZI|nr:hypothetical protein BT63DRAFT_453926 [Microthyrium microscopicum]